MNWIRNFSEQEGHIPPARNIEDAPTPMRQELIDFVFGLVEHNPTILLNPVGLHRVICQSLGVAAAGNPYAGYRYAAGRDINNQEWWRIYDLIGRLWPEFERFNLHWEYREGLNRILAGHGLAWDLGEDGRLHRVLPEAAQALVRSAIAELNNPRYVAASELLTHARDAYDDRPRRDRDACANVFDGMESVAKSRYGMPNATFGDVITELRRRQTLNAQVIGMLDSINTLRNRNFGHGMAAQFGLDPAEVDFAYLSCIGAILLLTRTP